MAERYRSGARTLSELRGEPDLYHRVRDVGGDEPSVKVRVDQWIVELIQELIESQKPSHVRAFVREALLAFVDQSAVAGQTDT